MPALEGSVRLALRALLIDDHRSEGSLGANRAVDLSFAAKFPDSATPVHALDIHPKGISGDDELAEARVFHRHEIDQAALGRAARLLGKP